MQLAQEVGIDPNDVNYVTYDGGGPLTSALLGKKIDVGFSGSDAAFVDRAFLALIAIERGEPRAALLWLFVALVIDGLDGTFARAAGVSERLPRIDGEALDLVIESDVNILDIAALAVIVREAGGVFTDLDGAPLSLDTTSVLAATPALHAAVLQRLRGWRA